MAAPIYPLERGLFDYTSDDTHDYAVGTTLDNGTAQSADPAPDTTNPAYPRGWVMRRVYGVTEDGLYRTHVPIMDPTDGLYVGTTATFPKGGTTFRVKGRRGEQMYKKGS